MAEITTIEFKVRPESSDKFDNEIQPKLKDSGVRLVTRETTFMGYDRVIYDGELMDGTFQELEELILNVIPDADIDFTDDGGMDGGEEYFFAEI